MTKDNTGIYDINADKHFVGTEIIHTNMEIGHKKHNINLRVNNFLKYDLNQTFEDLYKLGFRIKKIITDQDDETPISLTYSLIFTNKYLIKQNKLIETKIIYDENEIYMTLIDKDPLTDEKGFLKNTEFEKLWELNFKPDCIETLFEELSNQNLIELFVNMYDLELTNDIDSKIMMLSIHTQDKDAENHVIIKNEEQLKKVKTLLNTDTRMENINIRNLIETLPQPVINYMTDDKIKIISDSDYYQKMLSRYELKVEEFKKIRTDADVSISADLLHKITT